MPPKAISTAIVPARRTPAPHRSPVDEGPVCSLNSTLPQHLPPGTLGRRRPQARPACRAQPGLRLLHRHHPRLDQDGGGAHRVGAGHQARPPGWSTTIMLVSQSGRVAGDDQKSTCCATSAARARRSASAGCDRSRARSPASSAASWRQAAAGRLHDDIADLAFGMAADHTDHPWCAHRHSSAWPGATGTWRRCNSHPFASTMPQKRTPLAILHSNTLDGMGRF